MTFADTSALARAADRLVARFRRSIKRPWRKLKLRELRRANALSRTPVTGHDGPVVSLTSFGPRVATVFYTLETIAQGSLRPSRLILWLEDALHAQPLPDTLQRLARRGLEIRYCKDWGPHKKYFPYVMSDTPLDVALVTADDDHLYPRDWLARLHQAHRALPTVIHCFRAYRLRFQANGSIAPYKQWDRCESMQPSPLNFFTGCSGVLYPPAMQQALHRRGEGFADCCPRADDVWLNAVATWEGIPTRQVVPLPRDFPELPGSRQQGLARSNVDSGGNDVQLAATFRSEDWAWLHAQTQSATARSRPEPA